MANAQLLDNQFLEDIDQLKNKTVDVTDEESVQ
mgnify:CR=1 FL=1